MMELVEGPTEAPVSADLARELSAQLQDIAETALGLEIEAATAVLDGPHGRLRQCIVSQVWRMTPWIEADGRKLRLYDIGPSMKIVAARSGDAAVDVTSMTVLRDTQGPYVLAAQTITSIDVRAGVEEAEKVPANIRRAIVLLVEAHVLRSSEDGNVRSFSVDGAFSEGYNSPDLAMKAALTAVDALIRPYRRLVIA